MINLSEEYLKQDLTIINKIIFKIGKLIQLDVYYASSLYDMVSSFKENPPKKKDEGFKSGIVILDNLKIKKIPETDEDFKYLDKVMWEKDYIKTLQKCTIGSLENIALMELDCRRFFPYFSVKDDVNKRTASWRVGNSKNYSHLKKKFDFNEQSYVNIPVIFLQYMHDDENGWLSLRDLRDENIPCEDEESRLMKLFELLKENMKKSVLKPKFA